MEIFEQESGDIDHPPGQEQPVRLKP